MKAQRRHELKQNTLAKGLENLPEVSRRHGTKILVVVMVGLLVTLLIRNRVTNARADAELSAHLLGNARDTQEEVSARLSDSQSFEVVHSSAGVSVG